MRYLIDANVWLEGLIGGPQSADVARLISIANTGNLATTDFAIHTVGIVVTPREPNIFRGFLDDLVRCRIFTLHLAPSDLYGVLACMQATGLDFDDAFQYIAAERFDLRIVSFDTDFDRTPRGRMTVPQVLAELS